TRPSVPGSSGPMITEAQAVDLPRAALPRYPTPMWSIVWVIFWIARSPTAVLVIAAWFIDEAFFGFRAAALRRWRASRRARNLEDLLAHNPHDRRARFELADLLVARGRYQRAVDVLKPNLEAGDHDPATLLSMATACFGAGYPAQAEVFIAEARAQDPTHGFGALDLELGRRPARSGARRRASCRGDRPQSRDSWHRWDRIRGSDGDARTGTGGRSQGSSAGAGVRTGGPRSARHAVAVSWTTRGRHYQEAT